MSPYTRGHGLCDAGRLIHDSQGKKVWYQPYPPPISLGQLRAKCECGELSPDDVTTAAGARAWHRDVHKPAVARASREQ